MKRFISTLCLLVGASVASYAGIITSSAGLSGTNIYVQDFEGTALSSTFPLSSLPFVNSTLGNSGITVTISAGAAGCSGCPTSAASTLNTGSTARVVDQFSSRQITNQGGLDGGQANSFARFLILTFSQQISEFLIDYRDSDGTNGTSPINNMWINGTSYGIANSTSTAQIGATVGGNVPTTFSQVFFEFRGQDQFAQGDQVFFDNLRITQANGTVQTNPQTSGNQGAIPEPSTYALMGAGLLALGYARRKK